MSKNRKNKPDTDFERIALHPGVFGEVRVRMGVPNLEIKSVQMEVGEGVSRQRFYLKHRSERYPGGFLYDPGTGFLTLVVPPHPGMEKEIKYLTVKYVPRMNIRAIQTFEERRASVIGVRLGAYNQETNGHFYPGASCSYSFGFGQAQVASAPYPEVALPNPLPKDAIRRSSDGRPLRRITITKKAGR
jgi:hypothetical protein